MVALSESAKAGDKVRISLGALADKFGAIIGDTVVSFADGPVELALVKGQNTVTFSVLNTADVDVDTDIPLTATWVPAGASAVSHSIVLKLDAIDEPDPNLTAPSTTNPIAGDQAPRDFSPEPGIQPRADEWGNLFVEGAEPDRKDRLFDTPGNDAILAGGGSDTVTAFRGGDDLLDGGAGDDKLTAGGAGTNLLIGGAGNDNLVSNGSGRNKLTGGVENDALSGGGGADVLEGGTGVDVLDGGLGEDVLRGGEGNDFLLGFNYVPAGFGKQQLLSDEKLIAEGNDWLVVQVDQDQGNGKKIPVTLFKGFGDVSEADDGADTFEGGAGDDTVWSGSGDDRIDLGEGNDSAQGMGGADHIEGGAGNDNLFGDGGILTGFTNYTAPANQGGDFIDGGVGNDIIFGQGGADTLLGGEGDDRLVGDWFDFQQLGGQYHGADFLDGGAGDDIAVGGGGNDAVFGGRGQ